MLTYKDKVAIHNARCALERHMYCHSLIELPIEKILWQPKNYLDYIKHLAMHTVQLNTVQPVYLRSTFAQHIYPTHLQCDVCGAMSALKEIDGPLDFINVRKRWRKA